MVVDLKQLISDIVIDTDDKIHKQCKFCGKLLGIKDYMALYENNFIENIATAYSRCNCEEANKIWKQYDEIIEKQIKKRIDSALEIDNEVLSEQDIASARIRMRKRQQNKIDAELTPLKNRAKQCFKKNTGIGLLVGTALGGAYILFKKYNKKEI